MFASVSVACEITFDQGLDGTVKIVMVREEKKRKEKKRKERKEPRVLRIESNYDLQESQRLFMPSKVFQ